MRALRDTFDWKLIVSAVAGFVMMLGVGTAVAVNPWNGGPNADYFGGTSDVDDANGRGGPDTVLGKTQGDLLYGGDGQDDVNGEEGWDYLEGNDAMDDIRTGEGQNEIRGAAGDDQIYGTSNSSSDNVLRGGDSADYIDAQNGAADDEVDGGPGSDTCWIDNADQGAVSNCEKIKP